MPKLKTHKGIKKRFKVSATGKVSHKKCGSSHLMSHKNGKQVRRLRKKSVLKVEAEAHRVRRALHRAPTAPFRMAYFGKAHGLLDTPVIERGDLTSTPRPGPLIIEEYEGTTVVPPLATAIRDAHDNIVITLPVERSRAS